MKFKLFAAPSGMAVINISLVKIAYVYECSGSYYVNLTFAESADYQEGTVSRDFITRRAAEDYMKDFFELD